MTQFQFDTSGVVRRLNELGDESRTRPFAWDDLSPFVQGYVEAMLRHSRLDQWDGPLECFVRSARFSDLAPETLARIIEDCAAGRTYQWTLVSEHMMGVSFWRHRQQGDYGPTFLPLTIALNDQGKVVFL